MVSLERLSLTAVDNQSTSKRSKPLQKNICFTVPHYWLHNSENFLMMPALNEPSLVLGAQ